MDEIIHPVATHLTWMMALWLHRSEKCSEDHREIQLPPPRHRRIQMPGSRTLYHF